MPQGPLVTAASYLSLLSRAGPGQCSHIQGCTGSLWRRYFHCRPRALSCLLFPVADKRAGPQAPAGISLKLRPRQVSRWGQSRVLPGRNAGDQTQTLQVLPGAARLPKASVLQQPGWLIHLALLAGLDWRKQVGTTCYPGKEATLGHEPDPLAESWPAKRRTEAGILAPGYQLKGLRLHHEFRPVLTNHQHGLGALWDPSAVFSLHCSRSRHCRWHCSGLHFIAGLTPDL